MQERRAHPRLVAELRVRMRDLGDPRAADDSLTRDISRGGLFLSTTVGLPVGTLVDLEIDVGPTVRPLRFGSVEVPVSSLASPDLLRFRAEVVRVESEAPGPSGRVRGMGLRFIDPDPDAVQRLVEQAEVATRDLISR